MIQHFLEVAKVTALFITLKDQKPNNLLNMISFKGMLLEVHNYVQDIFVKTNKERLCEFSEYLLTE